MHGRESTRAMFAAGLASGFARVPMACTVKHLFEDGERALLEWRDPLGPRGCGALRRGAKPPVRSPGEPATRRNASEAVPSIVNANRPRSATDGLASARQLFVRNGPAAPWAGQRVWSWPARQDAEPAKPGAAAERVRSSELSTAVSREFGAAAANKKNPKNCQQNAQDSEP